MSTSPELLPTEPTNCDDSVAHLVLKSFLADALALPAGQGEGTVEEKQAEVDLRTDILYVLTDKIAHRRALPFRLLCEEVQKLQVKELTLSLPSSTHIGTSLRKLVEQRLVREFPAPEENQYELAHDFLVRFVVRRYRELDRRRISALAVLKQKRDVADAELKKLSRMGRAISFIVCGLPILTFTLSAYLIFLAINERLPEGIGLAYLWFIACPACVLLLVAIVTRTGTAMALAALILVFCAGTWYYEMSLPSVDIGSIYSFPSENTVRNLHSCQRLLGKFDYSQFSFPLNTETLLSTCISQIGGKDGRNMQYNANPYASTGDFCYDFGLVFSDSYPVFLALSRLCRRNEPEWRRNVNSLSDYGANETGFTLRPFQLDQLTGEIGLFALFILVVHVLLYPGILIATIAEGRAAAAAIRRIWADILDVTLTLIATICGGFIASSLRLRYGYPFSPVRFLTYRVIVTLGFGLTVPFASSLTLRFKRTTICGLLLGLATTQADDSVIPPSRILLRQLIHAVWSWLNFCFGIPSLILSPLYVWLRSRHQLFYDDWLRLKTEPVRRDQAVVRSQALHEPVALHVQGSAALKS
jgi:hypothetical protein